MHMDRQWMYGDRRHNEFTVSLKDFIRVTEENQWADGFMCCPCVDYQNKKDYSCSKTLHTHLMRFCFMPYYNLWTNHGEKGL
jgi:hypothetical protein